MQIDTIPGSSKSLRPNTSGFQRTFRTPLDRLPPFVERLLAVERPPVAATLTIEAVVFTPKNLGSLLASHNLSTDLNTARTITATGAIEVHRLLEAALGDWVDFYFVPDPKEFVIYADHDEYTTVFAPHKGFLSQLATALVDAGFSEVADYVREF